MDSTDNDVYEYDKCLFFKILESEKFQRKFETVQEQQGVVVCPLDIKNRPFNSSDLIDKHLFLPSPYYKNHFIPLVNANNNSSSSRLSSSSSNDNNVNLIVDDNTKFNLISRDVRGASSSICTNVKLLKTEIAYSAVNSRPYRILVVDRELVYGESKPPPSPSPLAPAITDDDEYLADYIDASAELQTLKNRPVSSLSTSSIKKRGSSISLANTQFTVKDVNTFSKAIDFLHNIVCVLDEPPSNGNKHNGGVMRRPTRIEIAIGENYLEEIELFKKTYIILYTHLNDYTNQAEKLFTKYTSQFGQAILINGLPADQYDSIECIVGVACEIALNGCLFSKLWPAVVKANEREDTRLCNRISLIRIKLGLDSEDEEIDEKTIEECVEYFHLEKGFFRVNLKPVLKELRKLELLNNPFERTEAIKACVDLLVNELTILSMGKNSRDVFTVTSENLIPMMAFILVRSSLSHIKSIVFFIDNFSFSCSSQSATNSYLAELSYFMTTFKAAIAFIEDS